jgi:hypothetical protein
LKYRNNKHINKDETDNSNRDFSVEAAQNLEDDESRGKSKTIKWEMIDESKSYSSRNLINYIVLYEKN